jgi:hypothetical protein
VCGDRDDRRGVAAGGDAVTIVYSDYLDDVRPVLHQWWNALEAFRGFHRRVWRDLESVELRFCGADPALWVRWDELTNTFRVFDAALGDFGPPAAPGSAVELQTDDATLFLAGTDVEDSGLTGTSVTLTLALAFNSTLAGRVCDIEAAATDDLGHHTRTSRRRASSA